MTKFELTCCSTADMSREYFEKRNIPFVCFHFRMDGVDYPDDMGISMPIDEFYKRIVFRNSRSYSVSPAVRRRSF